MHHDRTNDAPLLRAASRWVWALPGWAGLLGLSTLTHQPDPARDFAAYADYVTTTGFRASHLLASIAGAAAGIVGFVALAVLLQRSGAPHRALRALVPFATGQVLTISVFGAAAFAQPAIGRLAHEGYGAAAVRANDLVYGPALFTTAALGLVLLLVGTVSMGRAVVASGAAPRWAGRAFAVTSVLFVLTGPAGLVVQPVAAFALAAASTAIVRAVVIDRSGSAVPGQLVLDDQPERQGRGRHGVR